MLLKIWATEQYIKDAVRERSQPCTFCRQAGQGHPQLSKEVGNEKIITHS